MKIKYLSDLHLEFIHPLKINSFINKIKPNKDEICVLAGDIGNPYSKNYDEFMIFINNNFKKTFIIAGNHEYYNNGKTIDETKIFMKEYFNQYKNISFLDNSYELYENYYFVGCTLWSYINDTNYKINDIYSIKSLDCNKYNELNYESINFLENIITNNTKDSNNYIIITHHIPSFSLTDIIYNTPRMIPYNQWFCCEMDKFIEKNSNKIKVWIYGHTHQQSDKIMDNVRLICNPIGYPNENKYVNFNKVVEI